MADFRQDFFVNYICARMILDVSLHAAVTHLTIGLWIKRKIGAQEIGVDWNAYL